MICKYLKSLKYVSLEYQTNCNSINLEDKFLAWMCIKTLKCMSLSLVADNTLAQGTSPAVQSKL